MKIAIGGDHAGFSLKPHIVAWLTDQGHDVLDLGSYDDQPVDFPDIAAAVCKAINDGKVERAIMVCGTGVGAAIACNKVRDIRASVCHDVYTARQCVEHDDVNVMCMGAQIIGRTIAEEMVQTFLRAEFSTAPEFRRRVRKLGEMESNF
ncbi:ribose 5-phosphate isomerase B [Pelagibacterium mangrovi]|uniref:ribose 5-phosphate isomerase B n=1 Tax=Pelagibacterium mangrovi TaxID=3119828 RepID=UPI002FC9134F